MNNQEQYTATAPVITLTASKNADRLAVASFVCGILSMVFLLFGIIPAFAPGYLGYAFYSDAKRRGSSHGLLTAGQVMSIIGMALSLIAFAAVLVVIVLAAAGLSTVFS